ncbi:MAG: glutathione S-transferase family protein [Burkholderiales bacterium]|nr:glutathione S-transferase family protein [Burkholderiales bacterium]
MIHLYGSPISSPTNKACYLLNYMEIPYKFHDLNLIKGEHHVPEYLEINPYGKIPALMDEDFSLAESNAILRYLAAKYESPLYPAELKARAVVDQWLDYASQHIMIPFSKIMFNTYFYKLFKAIPDNRSVEDGHHFLSKNLPVLETQLNKFAHVAGDELTLADFAMLSALDSAELSKVDLSSYPYITAWRNKLMQQPFYTKYHDSYTVTFNKLMLG